MTGCCPASTRPQKIGTTPASPVGSCRGPNTLASRSTACLVWCSRLYRSTYCSAQYLAIPYGDSGSGSTSSRDGIGASRPYRAPPVEQNSTRTPAARAASSTLTVPTTLVCASRAGSATDTRTSICAARWQISSGRSCATIAATGSASVTLSLCSVTRSSRGPVRPADRSSITDTSSPLASRASVRCEPIKPAPPVTSTRICVVYGGAPGPVCRLASSRPPGQWRMTAQLADFQAQSRFGADQRPAEPGQRLILRYLLVIPRDQVGEDQLSRAGPGRVLAGLPRGEMQALGQVWALEEGRFAEQQVSVAGQVLQGGRLTSVGRVRQRPPGVLEPEAERLHRVIHVPGGDPQRADLDGPRRQGGEVEGFGHRGAALAAAAGDHPVRGARRAVYRDGRPRACRVVIPGDRIGAQVQAVIGVQVAQADRVDVVEPRITLQRPERPVAQIQQQPEPARLHQIAGGRAVRAGKAARAADDGEQHDAPDYAVFWPR